jgi:hypothetical protein
MNMNSKRHERHASGMKGMHVDVHEQLISVAQVLLL